MPDDYYDSSPDNSPGSAAVPAAKDTGADDDSMEGDTAMLPKTLFGDQAPEPGQEYLFKVEHVWEKEVEVSYAKADAADKPAGKKSTMDTATDAFDSMTQGKA